MSEQLVNQPLEDEISIIDIIDFFLDSWKVIIGFGLLGLIGGAIYLIITPNQYEAKAQIQMAQTSNDSTNPMGISVEEPNSLMVRLTLPSNYSSTEVKACGLDRERTPSETLVSMLRFSAPKGASSVIELKIQMESREKAVECLQAISDYIRNSQNQILEPHILSARALLVKFQDRLKKIQELVALADKSEVAFSTLYLASRDEVNFLTNETARLSTFISSAEARQAKLVLPIYVSEIPVFPKKKSILTVGLLFGLCLGILSMLLKKYIIRFKATS